MLNRFHDDFIGRMNTAHHFDYDINIRLTNDLHEVITLFNTFEL